jgi:hypothetical protein
MTTIEDRLLSDLPRIAATIETHPRPWKPPSGARRRGKRLIVGGVAVLALAGGGIALAKALIPGDVQRMHDQIDEIGGCGTVQSDQTRLVATAERADGNRLELWVAPTTSGLIADSLRTVNTSDGSWSGTSGGCGYERDVSWASASTEIADGESTGIIDVRGHIVDAVPSVVVTFASGATVAVEVQTDGYFLTSFRGDITKYETSAAVVPAS